MAAIPYAAQYIIASGTTDPAATPAFQQLVQMSLVANALTIYAEVNTTPGHVQRSALAQAILQAPETYAHTFTLAVLSQVQAVQGQGAKATVNGLSDAAIDALVQAVWNVRAGV